MLRFAVSTTKDLSVSNLRIALYNYMLSKKTGEELILRIEDIDKENSIEGKDKELIDLINLFSIEYASIIYQSENLKYYQKLAMQLMSQKKAFACFCSDEKIEELKQKAKEKGKIYSYDGFCETLSDETVLNCNAAFTVRIKKPEESISFNDELKGEIKFKPFEVDYFRILTHDKMPTYNYACAIDDMLYDISTIIRDEKFVPDTPRQIYLRESLNYDKEIKYIHLPKIENDVLVKDLIADGFLPSAIANYLLSLGTKPSKEVFELEEALEWFGINTFPTQSVTFDLEELKLLNKKHLELIDEMRLSKILGFADTDIGKLAKLFLSEVSTINEIKTNIEKIFSSKTTYDKNQEKFDKLKACIKKAPYFDTLDSFEAYISQETNLSKDEYINPLIYILTGRENGPDISDIYPLIKNYLGEIVK
ncbi:glutamate--tRNA ligase [Halarcobacter sp.]|uniref:glutamate--tRNA ligase n=1 Tax=Halarcobacter sp. TaxID=2321133 RepID=UPI0029F5787F|nr:glutamate--tRNA ligase [Halarcobacter sp.]